MGTQWLESVSWVGPPGNALRLRDVHEGGLLESTLGNNGARGKPHRAKGEADRPCSHSKGPRAVSQSHKEFWSWDGPSEVPSCSKGTWPLHTCHQLTSHWM